MKIGRNEKCPCGSGKKFKNCCIDSHEELSEDDLMTVVIDKEKHKREDYESAMNYLIIKTALLKTTWDKNGKQVVHPLLQVWEREKRDNRFNVRPLVEVDGDLVFSPIIISEFVDVWMGGIPKLYPPYEHGLPTLCEEFAKIKELYESQLEEDTANLFRDGKNIVLKSFEFHERDKQGNNIVFQH